MKRILLITLEYPPVLGGVAAYYGRLCAALPPGTLEVLPIKQLARYLRVHWALAWIPLLRELRRGRFESVLVGNVLPLGYPALMVRALTGTPYGVSVHGLDLLRPLQSRSKRYWLRFILSRASFVIANSEWTRRTAIRAGADEKRTQVVYPCVADVRAPRELPDSAEILSVARLVPRKGIDVLLRACAFIAKEQPRARLTIIGEGPDRRRLEDLAQSLGIHSLVNFRGAVSDDELREAYKRAAVFVLPTRESADDAEGFGLVFIEAASFGLPVIAGRGGGVAEAVLDQKTGILVDPENPRSVGEAVVTLLRDRAFARRLGEEGRARVAEKFTADAAARAFLSLRV